MKDFNFFLEHVMKNFAASYPYGLSKTDVIRISFTAWCQVEAQSLHDKESAPDEQPA